VRSMLSDVLGTGVAAPLPDRGVIETSAGFSSRRDTCGVWNWSPLGLPKPTNEQLCATWRTADLRDTKCKSIPFGGNTRVTRRVC